MNDEFLKTDVLGVNTLKFVLCFCSFTIRYSLRFPPSQQIHGQLPHHPKTDTQDTSKSKPSQFWMKPAATAGGPRVDHLRPRKASATELL